MPTYRYVIEFQADKPDDAAEFVGAMNGILSSVRRLDPQLPLGFKPDGGELLMTVQPLRTTRRRRKP